ncbi:mucin-4-like [Anopheles coustani]|uniref:mucin-4-like n=1 Tax=Anopheles coustani TaxID=139045 RepID=UPI002658A81F|nr:mucin-4-like [Anopheles coustani]
MPTINLSRDELIELLMLERDKENDTALAYLLQQETIPESSCSSEKTHNRPIETKDPGPVSETVLPMTIQPALAETSNLSPVASSSINTAGPMEQPASSTCQQSRPASDVAQQTGIKEIVAARILGSMAKGGFRSGPPNDTPPGNPIVKDTASGGTRSSSSRKRSHIRILDFGTPALKRSNTKPNPGGNTEERNVEAGSTSRQLFAKQGTPSYGGDSNEPDVQIAATFAMPATSTNATMVPPGQTTHVGNSQRVQNMNPIPHLRQVEDRLHGQINVNPGLVVSQTASSSSGKTVFTSNEIQTQLVGLDEVKSSSSEKPLDVRLLSAPTSEAPKVTNNGNSMREKTFDPKQHRVISTAEKKSRLIERTHSGTNLRTGVCLPSSQPIPSPSKPKQSSVRKSTHLREKTTTRDVVHTKHTNATLPRMVTRSSSMRMVEGDGNLSVNQITTKISKLPTKDNLPNILVPQQATMRRYESTSSLMAGEISALHTEPPETPFKFDPLNDYPMTPRFLTDPFLSVSKLDASAFSAVPLRDQPSAGRSSVVASLSETNDINTPGYPITPGALDTPKTQQSPTSAAVCYYRPDEGNAMQPPNETLPAEDPVIQERPDPGSSVITACTGKDPDKMEIVSGDLMFVISSTPLMELFEQEPSSAS